MLFTRGKCLFFLRTSEDLQRLNSSKEFRLLEAV